MSITMRGEYCKEDIEWRSGKTCSAIGTLLMIGTESSVFTLTIITGFRVYTVLRPFNEVSLRTIRPIIVLSWTLAIAIALIPLLPVTEDYFVDNVWLSQNPFFSIINKNEIRGINQWISTIQTENNDTLKNSTRENKALTNQQLKKRAKSMQKKVTVIIITDLLCWMPICIMGFLQVAGIDIPNDAYLPVGLMIIPINSMINPVLYYAPPTPIKYILAWFRKRVHAKHEHAAESPQKKIDKNGKQYEN
ncbi:relaxin receptor 1-like isoform X2 [Styela clava]